MPYFQHTDLLTHDPVTYGTSVGYFVAQTSMSTYNSLRKTTKEVEVVQYELILEKLSNCLKEYSALDNFTQYHQTVLSLGNSTAAYGFDRLISLYNPPEVKHKVNSFPLCTDYSLYLVETSEQFLNIVQKSPDLVYVDTETIGLRPFKGSVKFLQMGFIEGDTLKIFLCPSPVVDWKALDNWFKGKSLVFHNLKFDMHQLVAQGVNLLHPSIKLVDTMIMYRVFYPGILVGNSGLNDIISGQYPIQLDKRYQKLSFNRASYCFDMVDYAACDIYALHIIHSNFVNFHKQVTYLDSVVSSFDFFYELEMETLKNVFKMEAIGISLDFSKIESLFDSFTETVERLKAELLNYMGDSANPNSHAQVMKTMLQLANQKVTIDSTQAKDLEKLLGVQSTPNELKTFIKLFLEYKKTAKLLSFVTSLPLEINPETKKIHASFNHSGTATGRFSCIAEGEKVIGVGWEKSIEDVNVGDLVYSYTANGTVTIKPVTAKYNNGVKNCVSVEWVSVGNHKRGNLICTADHKLRLTSGEWVKAEELVAGQRLTHLRKVKQTTGRIRLYGANYYQEVEEQCIKREYFKASNKMHIHHSDTVDQAAKRLGVGTRTLKQQCKNRGIAYENHKVISVTYVGYRQVYDLEVQDTHNFIASEICVHNCNSPNMQQIPRDSRMRDLFTASPGCNLIVADYSQIELVIAAQITQDTTLLEAYKTGIDVHKLTASKLLNKPIEEVSKSDRQLAKAVNFGLVYGMGAKKLVIYAETSYGVSMSLEEAERFRYTYLNDLYPGVQAWHKRSSEELNFYICPPAVTLMGRNRLFRHPILGQAQNGVGFSAYVNAQDQGTGADIVKLALMLLDKTIDKSQAYPVLQVHDEIVVEATEEYTEQAKILLDQAMVYAGKLLIKDIPVAVEVGVGKTWAEAK